MDADEPLLAADGARIAVDDVVAMDGLTFRSRGERVLLVGDTAALFATLAGTSLAGMGGPAPSRSLDGSAAPGECSVAAGKLCCAGADVGAGAHWARVGVAPLDPALPADWSVLDYVTWSARLAGSSRKLAHDQARHALELMRLTPSAHRAVDRLPLGVRRAAVLAQALVTAPRVLLVEAPLRGLDGPALAFVLGALAAATDGRGAILTQDRLDLAGPGSALAAGATSTLVFARGALVLDADRALTRIYRLTVQANATALGEALAHAGMSLRGGPRHYTVSLPPELDTRAIFAAADAAQAPVVELVQI